MISAGLRFGKLTAKDHDRIAPLLEGAECDDCETAFATLIIWQDAYGLEFAECDGYLIIRSKTDEGYVYRLPIGKGGGDAAEVLFRAAGDDSPVIWSPEGAALDAFLKRFSDRYYTEEDDCPDYIYLRDDLAELPGKKYQAKRNHISQFSRMYDWKYEPLTPYNAEMFLECADRWYAENADRIGGDLNAEREGIVTLLKDAQTLGVVGGAITVDGRAAAISLGTPINGSTFDVHIEKALNDYAAAYSVINREFVRSLPEQFKYINREDDMGLEGLRRAKLSYHPVRTLRKFYCRPAPHKAELKRIYTDAFGEDRQFDSLLFGSFFDRCRYLTDGGRAVSMLFLFPCTVNTASGEIPARYLYAAATDTDCRAAGYMTRLIGECKQEGGMILLRPANSGLIKFYEKLGFTPISAEARKDGVPFVSVPPDLDRLAGGGDTDGEKFVMMCCGTDAAELDGLGFAYSMQ